MKTHCTAVSKYSVCAVRFCRSIPNARAFDPRLKFCNNVYMEMRLLNTETRLSIQLLLFLFCFSLRRSPVMLSFSLQCDKQTPTRARFGGREKKKKTKNQFERAFRLIWGDFFFAACCLRLSKLTFIRIAITRT